jgi:nucleoid-associated protein YejK
VIQNDTELQVTLERIQYFHKIVAQIRETEKNLAIYHGSAGGFLAEIDRMNLEVRESTMEASDTLTIDSAY